MMVFWTGVLIIASKPDLLNSVLNNTGLVNRSQFLLSFSIVIILYLLVYQIRKNKTTSDNLNNTIRKIALNYFVKELKEFDIALRAAKEKLKISEIPTKTMKRMHGESQFHKTEKFIIYNLNAIIQILNAYLRTPKILKIEKSHT